MELLEIFLPLCYVQSKAFGVTETILQLVKRLLLVQKELNLKFSPEFYSVFVSISYVLSQAEFEHEQLAGLKLLLFLTEWRFQSGLFLCIVIFSFLFTTKTTHNESLFLENPHYSYIN